MYGSGHHHARAPVGKPIVGRSCQAARRPLARYSVQEGSNGLQAWPNKIIRKRVQSGWSRGALAPSDRYTRPVRESTGQTPLWTAVPFALAIVGGASHRDEAMSGSRRPSAAVDSTRRAGGTLPKPSLTLPPQSPGNTPSRQSTNERCKPPSKESLLIGRALLQWLEYVLFDRVHVCVPRRRPLRSETHSGPT